MSVTVGTGEVVSRPAILSIDDDPQVLAAVSRDSRQHYGENYRVVRASSGAEALETLNELLSRGDAVAAFVVDQRMPEMSGTEFLMKAVELFPDAKKVLLTAYARHGCRHRRDQRCRTGPLPAEALGPAGGEPLPRAG